jgi:hypothetical protein
MPDCGRSDCATGSSFTGCRRYRGAHFSVSATSSAMHQDASDLKVLVFVAAEARHLGRQRSQLLALYDCSCPPGRCEPNSTQCWNPMEPSAPSSRQHDTMRYDMPAVFNRNSLRRDVPAVTYSRAAAATYACKPEILSRSSLRLLQARSTTCKFTAGCRGYKRCRWTVGALRAQRPCAPVISRAAELQYLARLRDLQWRSPWGGLRQQGEVWQRTPPQPFYQTMVQQRTARGPTPPSACSACKRRYWRRYLHCGSERLSRLEGTLLARPSRCQYTVHSSTLVKPLP